MKDFEVKRWEAAKALLGDAFWKGYTNAKARLAADPSLKTVDAPDTWDVKVPWRDIADGLAPTHAPSFEQHGRDAALAKRREYTEADIQVITGPKEGVAPFDGEVVWRVWLERQDIALPR
jgi:hypothetical protein